LTPEWPSASQSYWPWNHTIDKSPVIQTSEDYQYSGPSVSVSLTALPVDYVKAYRNVYKWSFTLFMTKTVLVSKWITYNNSLLTWAMTIHSYPTLYKDKFTQICK
jgi:hypothetical protein